MDRKSSSHVFQFASQVLASLGKSEFTELIENNEMTHTLSSLVGTWQTLPVVTQLNDS